MLAETRGRVRSTPEGVALFFDEQIKNLK